VSPTGHHGRWGADAADAERGTPRGRNGATAEASRIGFNRCRGIGRRFGVAERHHGQMRRHAAGAGTGRPPRPWPYSSRLPTGRGRVPPTGTTGGAERGTPPQSGKGRLRRRWPYRFENGRRIGRRSVPRPAPLPVRAGGTPPQSGKGRLGRRRPLQCRFPLRFDPGFPLRTDPA
jgi:hypothetical protein